jgi:hypothetical protein
MRSLQETKKLISGSGTLRRRGEEQEPETVTEEEVAYSAC